MAELVKEVEKKYDTVNVEVSRCLHQEILQCGMNLNCAQEACNRVFSVERRERMIAGASVDRKGRRVRYYRYMARNVFLRALEEGNHSVENNHIEDFDRRLDEKDIYAFFDRYVRACAKEDEFIASEDLTGLFNRITNDDEIKSFLLERDPGTRELVHMTNRNIIGFIVRFCERKDVLESIHMGSMFPEFSPYLSVSVGGPFVDRFERGGVVLELVLPDELVSSIPSQFLFREKEKHVFVFRGISLDQISRVFLSEKQYREEVLENLDVPVGEWIHKRESPVEKDQEHLNDNGIRDWIRGESIDDCLPVKVLERYQR